MDASKVIGNDGVFATRLRELMKSAKATQQDVAAAVGTTRQAISQYADGSVQPNIEKLYKIAEYFNVSADYLLGISDITASDVDDKAINQMLGLSEKAISKLKEEVALAHLLSDIKNTSAAIHEYDRKNRISNISIINLLLEEPYRGTDTILTLLGDIFMHEHDKDPDAVFLLAKSVAVSDNECKEEVIPNTAFLTDADVLAVRLLKLQQAIAFYKKELD